MEIGQRAAHVGRALKALTTRELTKFVQQRGRLLSALVRPLMWLAVFAAGFYNVFGVSIIPPYKTYITYQVYIVPGLLGIILLFHGMQSSLSMVYDREMGVMRLLLTAPLPRWVLLVCKLVAGTALAVLTCYVFLAVCILFDVTFRLDGWLTVLPALIVSGLMLGSLWLFLSVHIKQLENFAGAMNFVMFPMFFFSSALYPLWKLREGGSELVVLHSARQPVHACGRADPLRALRRIRTHCRRGRRRLYSVVLSARGAGLQPAARHHPPRGAAGVNWPRTRAISFRIFSSSAAVLVSRGRGIGTSPMTWVGLDDSRNSRSARPIASSMSWVTRSVVICRLATSAASSSRRWKASAASSGDERLIEHQQIRLDREGARERDAAGLAERQLAGKMAAMRG